MAKKILKSEFITPLMGFWVNDDNYQLTAPLVYASVLLQQIITLPVGFTTDFASVPRVPIVYEMFGDKAHHESTIHDGLYYYAPIDRQTADSVFLEAMEARGKSNFVAHSMFLGVRVGGWKAWNDHRKKGDPQVPLQILTTEN